jgi:hypothetical protein
MYYKLVSNHTTYGGTTNLANDTYRRIMMLDFYNIILGNITTPAGLNSTVWNTATSVITGTAPTAGMYSVGAHNLSSSASYNAHYFEIIKKHYGYKSNNNFTANRTFRLHWVDDYGVGPRMTTHTTNNPMPGGTSNNWNGSGSSSGYHYRFHDTPSSVYSWEGVINDDMIIMMMQINGPYTTGNYVYTFVMADQEYQSNIDDHYLALNAYYCPTAVGSWSDDKLDQPTAQRYSSTGTNAHWHMSAWGKTQVYGATGLSNSNITVNGQQHKGYYSTSQYNAGYYASTWPQMWMDFPNAIPIANGDSGYQMMPMYYVSNYGTDNYGNGSTSYHKDYKGMARMMGLWRTNDNAFNTGERVVDADGTAWRAFRSWKCGGGYGGYGDPGFRCAIIMAKENAA